MSRLGTCKWAFQIQEMFTVGNHPHDKMQRVDPSDEYTCDWLKAVGTLPPPIRRKHGGMEIMPGDCDNCERYEPPQVHIKAGG